MTTNTIINGTSRGTTVSLFAGDYLYNTGSGVIQTVAGLLPMMIGAAVLLFSSQTATAQAQHQTLRNGFTGPSQCLDIVNDGQNNNLRMAPCGNYSGQHWMIEIGRGGYARLRTEFTGGESCLDVVNDGRNDRLQMATCRQL
jgi:putative lipase involved disintegration of autophagic bodies